MFSWKLAMNRDNLGVLTIKQTPLPVAKSNYCINFQNKSLHHEQQYYLPHLPGNLCFGFIGICLGSFF